MKRTLNIFNNILKNSERIDPQIKKIFQDSVNQFNPDKFFALWFEKLNNFNLIQFFDVLYIILELAKEDNIPLLIQLTYNYFQKNFQRKHPEKVEFLYK